MPVYGLAEKFDLERIDVSDYQQLSPAIRLALSYGFYANCPTTDGGCTSVQY
ncbi:Uncharacterised protein [Serratia rubidaea]|nr:Uncharacterised protein [Serratia rubidaea]